MGIVPRRSAHLVFSRLIISDRMQARQRLDVTVWNVPRNVYFPR